VFVAVGAVADSMVGVTRMDIFAVLKVNGVVVPVSLITTLNV